MSKIVCDVCGSTYSETEAQCPICGTAKSEAAKPVADTYAEEQAAKGGELFAFLCFIRHGSSSPAAAFAMRFRRRWWRRGNR